MRPARIVRLASAALVLPLVAAAPTPFPAGYEESYQAYLKSLPTAVRSAPWLSRLNGVTAPPTPMTIGGKPTLYLFGCKNHFATRTTSTSSWHQTGGSFAPSSRWEARKCCSAVPGRRKSPACASSRRPGASSRLAEMNRNREAPPL